MNNKTVKTVPELAALRLVTIYGDGTTTLVSLTHQVVIADFDGDEPMDNIPHIRAGEFEVKAGKAYYGNGFNDQWGWPGWPAIFKWLERHPSLLESANE